MGDEQGQTEDRGGDEGDAMDEGDEGRPTVDRGGDDEACAAQGLADAGGRGGVGPVAVGARPQGAGGGGVPREPVGDGGGDDRTETALLDVDTQSNGTRRSGEGHLAPFGQLVGLADDEGAVVQPLQARVGADDGGDGRLVDRVESQVIRTGGGVGPDGELRDEYGCPDAVDLLDPAGERGRVVVGSNGLNDNVDGVRCFSI